ncbi:hypothetical protein [Natronorubrum daqingense]|uniref:Uncharacterized protein n=1 Tax=Natronorubrum daqingense TaxID=588898 RepID=A0A1N6Z9M9_9EURY|nr:hypothetical protein [Natronorubrum daqingense]APX95417.1 hypothetical protein BB347_01640 [Natronorubrum daqingense]SIR23479.1 hypothetical protein SAMN05421809_0727 [Natronorubrum daqingense]
MSTAPHDADGIQERLVDHFGQLPAGVYVLVLVLFFEGVFSYLNPAAAGEALTTAEIAGVILPLLVVGCLLSGHPIGWLLALTYFGGTATLGLFLGMSVGSLPLLMIVVYGAVVIYLLAVSEHYDDPFQWITGNRSPSK